MLKRAVKFFLFIIRAMLNFFVEQVKKQEQEYGIDDKK